MTTKEKKNVTIAHRTEAELHAFLNTLTEGQIVTATWEIGSFSVSAAGPVGIKGKYAAAYCRLRGMDGDIDDDLTSVEATVEQPITVTRDDPDAMLALIESLADGQKITAEWRSADGERVMTITGPVKRDDDYGLINVADVWDERIALTDLHSVTTTATRTVRWEREA